MPLPTMFRRPAAGLKPFQGFVRRLPAERCYACGEEEMIQIQVCKYLCKNCGALLDCEDLSGLPK
jgi:hypothetical protein